MLKQYQELLDSLQRASAQARAMQVKGAPTDRVYRGLAAPIKEVQTRLAHLREVEARQEREERLAAEAAKAEATTESAESTEAKASGASAASGVGASGASGLKAKPEGR